MRQKRNPGQANTFGVMSMRKNRDKLNNFGCAVGLVELAVLIGLTVRFFQEVDPWWTALRLIGAAFCLYAIFNGLMLAGYRRWFEQRRDYFAPIHLLLGMSLLAAVCILQIPSEVGSMAGAAACYGVVLNGVLSQKLNRMNRSMGIRLKTYPG